MRRAHVTLGVTCCLITAYAVVMASRRSEPTLVVRPTGEPRFEIAYERSHDQWSIVSYTNVCLIVAITNNTSSTLIGHADVFDQRAWDAGLLFLGNRATPFAHGQTFKVGPHSGTLCQVRYRASGSWVVGVDYARVLGPTESNLRQALTRLGIKGFTTNQSWKYIQVGKMVQH